MAVEDIKLFEGRRRGLRRMGSHPQRLRAHDQELDRPFMLHDCECSHLGKDSDDTQLTAKRRRCGSRRDLVEWTSQQTGSSPLFGQSCM